MLCITKELDEKIEYIEYTGYKKDEVLFFDIETTGFSPETTILYMIGCIYCQQDRLICTQWFSDNKNAQKDVLIAFMEFISNYKLLICYNGLGFDIPYLQKKCHMYKLPYHLEQVNVLDIYKQIQPFRSVFHIPNLKQKSIEIFLGINREDKYNGGELIEIYLKYLENHSNEYMNLLTLHNRDDLTGMTKLLPILSYKIAYNGGFDIEDIQKISYNNPDCAPGTEVTFSLRLSCPAPKRVSFGSESVFFLMYDTAAVLTVKAHTDELKFFYPNYKDYYYLPQEDTAIHKSVAFYVDKNFRTRAKAANCYSKKTGCFLPQYDEVITPYFKIDYYDKITYFEFTDEFKTSRESVKKYVSHIINHLIRQQP